MALATAAIAEHGKRPHATFRHGEHRPMTEATSARVARQVARAMRAVVTSGTGVGAAISGVEVAGKTGTAELRSTVNNDPEPTDPTQPPPEQDVSDTDAWFTAFAPLHNPEVAVCVLLVGQGAGGATAAPAAKTVIQAALD
jgi:cell division protein FtsI/penicillin-binding protein 2